MELGKRERNHKDTKDTKEVNSLSYFCSLCPLWCNFILDFLQNSKNPTLKRLVGGINPVRKPELSIDDIIAVF
jgi:hypothetical protein